MTSPPTPTRLLHEIPAAADQLSVSARVVERLIKAGQIDSVKVGRRRLVPHDALEDYVRRLREDA